MVAALPLGAADETGEQRPKRAYVIKAGDDWYVGSGMYDAADAELRARTKDGRSIGAVLATTHCPYST